MSRSLRQRRIHKFNQQGGRCWWCGKPMELQPFRCTPTGRVKSNGAYATFEHLTRKRDGGLGKPNNVVLAHATCNRERERRRPPQPAAGEATA